jgi:outer membrane lipoprotein-sorting protein
MMSFCVIAVVVFFCSSVYGMNDKSIDDLIAKMEKASDPEGVKSKLKTQINKIEITIPAQKIKLNATITNKYPNKTKTFSEIPGIMSSTRAYNGKTGWEYSPAAGMRDIKGKELASMRLEVDMKNPLKSMRDIFMKIEVPDETEKVGEFECYKFICTPKEEYNSRPVTIFIDTKAFLVRKMLMVADTKMGPVKMESIFSDYKAVNKLMTPMLSTIKQMGMIMKVKVIEIKDNVNIDDSEFEKPEPVE